MSNVDPERMHRDEDVETTDEGDHGPISPVMGGGSMPGGDDDEERAPTGRRQLDDDAIDRDFDIPGTPGDPTGGDE